MSTASRTIHPHARPHTNGLGHTRKNHVSAVIIGGGKISEQHLRTLRAMEDVHVDGICDLSPALARFTAERYGVAGWHTDYREMLEQCSANVVHVLTPPATHDRIVRDCLANGRHVIVEKPIALSNDVFRGLWDDASSRNLRIIENHNYRFNTPIQQLESVIATGRIGAIEEVEVRMVLDIRSGGRYADENLPHESHRLPAGVIHEFVTHLSYLLLNFMPDGCPAKSDTVHAMWRNHGGGNLFKYDDLDATILAGSVHGRIRFSCHQWPDCLAVHVRGSEGVAMAELFHPMVQVTTTGALGRHLTPMVTALAEAKVKACAGIGSVWRKIRDRSSYEGLHRFLHLTYESLRTGSEPPVGFDQMDRTTRLVDAMLARENRA